MESSVSTLVSRARAEPPVAVVFRPAEESRFARLPGPMAPSDFLSPTPTPCPTTPEPQRADPARDVLLHAQYRQLACRHLQSLPALFEQLTGLRAHVTWTPAGPRSWDPRALPKQLPPCRAAMPPSTACRERCRQCATEHLALALQSAPQGTLFTCYLNRHNFWLPIIVRQHVLGLSLVQAPARPDSTGSSREGFARATGFLRFVVSHVQTAILADLRESDLAQARQALRELQTAATRLREQLHRLLPVFKAAVPQLAPARHSSLIVQQVLDYIDQHYSEPFTLQQLAREQHTNAAYLSAQFSHAVGIPFKTYLTEVRIQRARQLLSDPARPIAGVAAAVGYTSPNRFRLAFRRVTGLSPRQWRDTLRMPPDPAP